MYKSFIQQPYYLCLLKSVIHSAADSTTMIYVLNEFQVEHEWANSLAIFTMATFSLVIFKQELTKIYSSSMQKF